LERVENEVEVATQPPRSDGEVAQELRRLFASDAALSDASVEVAVEEGQIVLSGKVADSFLKSRAKSLAMHAGGSQTIDARGLQVDYESRDGTLRRQRLAQLTDKQIRQAVRRALRYDPRVLSFAEEIDVDSEAGAVTLSGQVERLQAKQAAEETARGTLGVWRVKNHLKVHWSEDDPSADTIVAYVQAALQRDPYVTRHELRVHCRNGHVSLYGLVDSPFEKRAAEWIAGGQRGVVHVNNYLTVAQAWEAKSDAEIKADIEEKLKRTFFDKSNQIRVTVEDGVAVLNGQVDTWRQWQAAMDQVVAAGARRPHNLLEVRYHPQHGGSQIYVPR
jgi:osmotically-inducible protein OsmY